MEDTMTDKATATQMAKEPEAVKINKAENLSDTINGMFDRISQRAFELFEGSGRIFGRDLEDWFDAEKELFHPMHIKVTEAENNVEVRAEVPGFTENDLEIQVEPRRLTITGRRETKKEETKDNTTYSETCSNEIFRVVDLPVEVDAAKATSTLKNGMLELTIPKAAKAEGIHIQPKAA
jgi:HSP20 family protein